MAHKRPPACSTVKRQTASARAKAANGCKRHCLLCVTMALPSEAAVATLDAVPSRGAIVFRRAAHGAPPSRSSPLAPVGRVRGSVDARYRHMFATRSGPRVDDGGDRFRRSLSDSRKSRRPRRKPAPYHPSSVGATAYRLLLRAPDPPIRRLIREFLRHVQRLQRSSLRAQRPSD